MKRRPSSITIVVDRRAALLVAAVAVVGGAALLATSETLTLSTTYPAPVGVYNQIVTTGDAGTVPASTVLARNAGHVLLAPPTNAEGNVGVGAAVPLVKLDVNGPIRVGQYASDPTSGYPGEFYYNSARGVFRVYTGSGWGDVGGTSGTFCGFYPLMRIPGQRAVDVRCQGQDIARGCPPKYTAVNLGIGMTCARD